MTEGRGPDFIGVGAQKAGTSWIYACLYEHPEICIPVKEIHFFSHEDKWNKGKPWYESHFAKCEARQKAGEFCTTYLSHPKAARRIHNYYPSAKLLACLRNPVDRAFSNYVNDIKAGVVPSAVSFGEVLADHPEYIQRGFYSNQLRRFLDIFPRSNIYVCLYEDIEADPLKFIQRMYKFIGVNDKYVPEMLDKRINVSRIPRFNLVEELIDWIARKLRASGLDNIAWLIKKSGLPDMIRGLNSKKGKKAKLHLCEEDRRSLYNIYKAEMSELEELIGISVECWRMGEQV